MRYWPTALLVGLIVLLTFLLRHDAPERGARAPRAPGQAAQEDSRTEPIEPTPGRDDASAEGTVAVQVRNLANCAPVPAVNIRARADGSLVSSVSDAAGIVELPANAAAVAVAAPWTVAFPDKPIENGVLWIHGWISIDGLVTVRGDPTGFAPERASLYVLVDGHAAPPGLPDIGVLSRLASAVGDPGQPARGGSFAVVVPRLHGITLAATLEGWKSAKQTIDVAHDVENEHVELCLERALRIRGVVRSSDGNPIENLPMSCLSLVATTPEEATVDQMKLLKPNGGFTSSVDLVTGTARAKFTTMATTDKEGRFELSVPISGEVLVVAFPYNSRPVYRDVGVPGTDDMDLDIVAEAVHVPSLVRLVASGKSFEGGTLFVADLSLKDGDAQPGVYLKIDSESRVSSDWLIPGSRFFFQVGRFSGHMIWDNRSTLDVAKDLRPVTELPSR